MHDLGLSMDTDSRTPHGERGLKWQNTHGGQTRQSRSPHGERGLKYENFWAFLRENSSLPTRGAWIEIHSAMRLHGWPIRRSPHGERGLKYQIQINSGGINESLPTRGAWIEMYHPRW